MGVVLAVSPIAGQLFGAKKLTAAGNQLHQAAWLALMLAVPGCLLLCFPAPFMALSQASPEVEGKVRAYLGVLAFSLPASLLFSAFRGFNTAVSRPKAVMALNLGGLALKVPLSILFLNGWAAVGLPAMGVQGCALATAVAMWSQFGVAFCLLRKDPFYRVFGLGQGGLHAPDWAAIGQQLRLGVPMGLGILIEVSAFSMMAIFIARLGTTQVAGHQIAVNLVSLMFMLPMAMAQATSTLVAQSVGARDLVAARRLGWHGLQWGLAVAALMGVLVFLARGTVVGWYTQDGAVRAAALALLAWLPLFHMADAAQVMASFALRAWRVATLPMLIFAVCLWGVGLGGGFVLAFDVWGITPRFLLGAPGYWVASTVGLGLAAAALCVCMAWVLRKQMKGAAAAPHGAL
jgi:multidrug resistance protein, MATE family